MSYGGGYNPYAAPGAAPPSPYGPGGGAPSTGEPQPWDVSEVLRAAWEAYKGAWAPLTFGIALTSILGMIPGQIAPTLAISGKIAQGSSTYWAVHAPLSILGWIMSEFFAAGIAKAGLSAMRTGQVSFGDLFSGPRFLPFLAMSFLRTFVIVLGFFFLIAPGVILALGFANSSFYCVDQGLGPIASLKASWESADGQKGNLFVLLLAELGIVLAGMLACCGGMFVALPIMVLANSLVYMRMSGAMTTKLA